MDNLNQQVGSLLHGLICRHEAPFETPRYHSIVLVMYYDIRYIAMNPRMMLQHQDCDASVAKQSGSSYRHRRIVHKQHKKRYYIQQLKNYKHVRNCCVRSAQEDLSDHDIFDTEKVERLLQETNDITFEQDPSGHKMGFVAIIGRPNAGKSTLMNHMLGQQLSIVTQKAQTTRHRILGIWSEQEHQVVFLDTPGIISKQRDELEEKMMASVTQAIQDADALIAIVDVTDRPEQALEMIQPGADWEGPPMVVVLNKMDAIDEKQGDEIVAWYKRHCNASAVLPISALEGHHVEHVKDWVLANLPEGPSLYPKDIVSEASERFFVSEIIRKQVFLQYRQELPYQVAVQVTQFKDREPPKKTFISANVIVEKERHLGLIIGAKGSAIKSLSSAARKDIEEFLEVPVYLDLSVKVIPGWRSDNKHLDNLGYV